MGRTIAIPTDGLHCIGAWRADPAVAPRGGVVVVQEVFGVNAHVRGVAERFAAAGYVAIAPAMFDFAESGVELGYDENGVTRGRTLAAEVGFERAVSAVASAAQAINSAGTIGVVGYCWGGTVAFLACTRLGLPAVNYYGARSVPFLHETPRAALLCHFGERDPLIPAETVQAHRAALNTAQIHVYPAGHAFNREVDPHHYDASSSQLAFERTLAFFAQHLDRAQS